MSAPGGGRIHNSPFSRRVLFRVELPGQMRVAISVAALHFFSLYHLLISLVRKTGNPGRAPRRPAFDVARCYLRLHRVVGERRTPCTAPLRPVFTGSVSKSRGTLLQGVRTTSRKNTS